ncbi:hypothetical protein EON65_48770 [archaeon]|nr:MAG: hypothetical protein EON65_48770 [archaeon]
MTRKEYLIALRNRLFVVDEKLWMQEYCDSLQHVLQTKIPKLKPDKVDQFKKYKEEMLSELPLAQLQNDLEEAKSRKLPYAARHIQRLIANYQRQMPQPLQHLNQIATVSYAGQVMTVMRGHGKLSQHLGYAESTVNRDVRRQFQLPVFSDSGKYVSFLELHFPKERENKLSKPTSEKEKNSISKPTNERENTPKEREPTILAHQSVLIHEVPKDPDMYGDDHPFPVFHSGHLPHTPLFVRFSPDDNMLAMICETKDDVYGNGDGDAEYGYGDGMVDMEMGMSMDASPTAPTSLVLLEWTRYSRPDTMSTLPDSERFLPRHPLSVLQGDSVFFSYTTSSPYNATILAHVDRPIHMKNGQKIIPDVRQQEGSTLLYLPGQLQETGIYELKKQDSTAAILAFNDNRKESDLSYLSVADIDKLLPGKGKTIINDKQPLTSVVNEANYGVQLWKLCIILAMIFLAAEIVLIRYYKTDRHTVKQGASTQTTH